MSTCLNRTTDHTARPVVPDEPGLQSTNCDGHGKCASMRAESDRAPGEVDRSVGPSVLGGCSVWKALSHSSCRVDGTRCAIFERCQRMAAWHCPIGENPLAGRLALLGPSSVRSPHRSSGLGTLDPQGSRVLGHGSHSCSREVRTPGGSCLSTGEESITRRVTQSPM